MKKVIILLVLTAMAAFFGITGCTTDPNSSNEEVRYVVEHLPDFQSIAAVQQINTLQLGIWGQARTTTIKEGTFVITHIVVYKTKTGHRKMVFLDGWDQRPPKIVHEEFVD